MTWIAVVVVSFVAFALISKRLNGRRTVTLSDRLWSSLLEDAQKKGKRFPLF